VSGTATLLFDTSSGVTAIERGFSVAALGASATQVAVIGASGTGTVIIGSNSTETRLGRSVTLQAADSATAVFAGLWKDLSGNDNPAVAYTIGSQGNAGVVVFESTLSSAATALNIVRGTARLQAGVDDAIGSATPVTIGSAGGSGTLDLNGQSQTLSNVTFTGNSSSITSGTLRLAGAGTLAVDGTGHAISSAVALDAAAGINVGSGGLLQMSSEISGGSQFTKSGAGILQLTGVNTYTGTTAVTGGRLLVDGAGDLSSTARVVINGAGSELKWNSSAPLSRPLDLVQGTISGTGTISAEGGVTVGTSGILSPGNSPGIQSYTTGLTWASGGSYLWEINDWTGAAGTAYDQLAVSGSPLDITATSGSTFNILITSLSGTANTAGNVPNFDGNVSRTFTLATSSAGITGFDASKFFLDTSAFSNTYSGSFSITSTGSAVLLNYLYTPAYTSTDYTLTAAAGTANIRVGGTTSITATVTNTGTGTADALAVSGLGVTVSPAGTVTLSPTSGTAAIDNGTVAGSGVFTGTAAGAYSFTPSVSSATNVNLATPATLTSTGSATVSVYNVAAPNSITGTISLGSIITGGTFGTQALTISNTAAAGSYSEKLDAVFGSPTGGLTASGSISLLASGSTDSTNMLVGLTSSGSVGVASGSVVVDFTSNGDGTSGLGTVSAGSQTVWVEGTVLAHSQASLLSTLLTSGTINLGMWDYEIGDWLDGDGTAGFSIFNLASTSPELTAALEVTGTSMTGSSGFSFDVLLNSLIAGGTSAGYTASFDPNGFTTKGTYTAIFTILTSDQTNLSGATAGNTLTVTASVIVVPEPQALALAAIGIAAVVYAARRRK
jgi:autotransporter-associated beta strand protein